MDIDKQLEFVKYQIAISEFVEEVCKNRDESHGHIHMKQVMELSGDIFCKMFGKNARTYAEEHFNIEKIGDSFERILILQ